MPKVLVKEEGAQQEGGTKNRSTARAHVSASIKGTLVTEADKVLIRRRGRHAPALEKDDPCHPIEIGKRIQQVRVEQRLTQADIARLAGVSTSAAQQWESGIASPQLSRLALLADLVRVRRSWLAFDEGVAEETIDEIPTGYLPPSPPVVYAPQLSPPPRSRLLGRGFVGSRVPLLPLDMAPNREKSVPERRETGAISSTFTHHEVSRRATASPIEYRDNVPVLEPGDICVMDPAAELIFENFVAFAVVDSGPVKIRRYLKGPEDTVVLKALNPSFGEETMTEERWQAVHWRAKVIEWTKKG